jgi:hypothetical protein
MLAELQGQPVWRTELPLRDAQLIFTLPGFASNAIVLAAGVFREELRNPGQARVRQMFSYNIHIKW